MPKPTVKARDSVNPFAHMQAAEDAKKPVSKKPEPKKKGSMWNPANWFGSYGSVAKQRNV